MSLLSTATNREGLRQAEPLGTEGFAGQLMLRCAPEVVEELAELPGVRQLEVAKDGRVLLELSPPPSRDESLRQVLAWGSRVEVVSPTEFRQAVADELLRAVEQYGVVALALWI